MISILNLIQTVANLYMWVVIAAVIMTWLVQFNVLNRSQPLVRQIGEFLYRITEPALRPIRNILPDFGGIDISPVILILLLGFIPSFLREMLVGY
ncbi:MAG: YggT family protein [Geminicoccaceae bacterium]